MTDLAALSRRTNHLREASILRALTLKVNAFADGINLGQGVCDLEMPGALRDAAVRSLTEDRATYTNFAGIKPLREQIIRRMRERYDLSYEMDEVVVTVGASMAYTSTLMTLIDPGDEVILFEPFYPYHYTGALLAGATVRSIPLSLGDGGIQWDKLEGALSDRTRLIVLNTPSNPLGKVWTTDELDRLAALLDTSPAYIVTDEIYEDLVYDGREHVPPATRPGLYERTITISGLSKAYSITGWRLGWLAAPKALSGAIGPVFDVLAVCASRPLQHAAAAALAELPETYYTELRDGYSVRRRLLCDALRSGGFQVREPEGSYYVMADYTDRWGADTDPEDACFRLLDEARIAAIPATIFYAERPRPELRFQFAVEDTILEEVGRRLG